MAKKIDVQVEGGGKFCTVYLFRPLTKAAKNWLKENVSQEERTEFGGAIAVEHRFAPPLVQGMKEAGLKVAYKIAS